LRENTDSKNEIDSLSTKLQQLRGRVERLLPKKRLRRGLINGLGKVVKIVTGNLDEDDGRRIENNFKTITNNQKELTAKANKQEIFNNDIKERFNNITEHINREQQIINQYLNNYKNMIFKNLNSEHHISHTLQYISRININIDVLSNHLNNIEESMLLARLNIVPNFIVSEQELTIIRHELNDPELCNLSNEHILDILELDTFMIGIKINFRIKIPTFKQDVYQFSHIVPLPINESKFLILPKYMAYHDAKDVHYFMNKCNRVDKHYICENLLSIRDNPETECLNSIFTLNAANCKVKDVGNKEIITEIEPGHILILNTVNSTIASNCTTKFSIKGSALVTFKNCEVSINQIPYDKELSLYEEKIDVTIPIIQNINFTDHIEDINLHNLNLRSINASNSIIYWKNFTTTNFGAVYLLLLFGIVVSVLLINMKKKVIFSTIPEPSFVTSTPSLWPSLQSRRGGVTDQSVGNDPPAKPPRATLELVR